MTPDQKVNRIAMAIVAAAGLAIPAEGLYQTAYSDPVGILTVCYGHTETVQKGKTYTKEECMGLLSKDMGIAVKQVDQCLPDLPFGVLVAFSDATFNMGPTIACNTSKSTAARYLKAKQYVEACKQLPRWNRAKKFGVSIELPGLTKRRNAEMEVCLKGATGA